MAKDAIPTIRSLDKPEDLQTLLKSETKDDCLSCRLIGSGAFLTLAGYNYLSGTAHLESQRAKILASKSMFGMASRRAGVAGISLGLMWMGIYRLMN